MLSKLRIERLLRKPRTKWYFALSQATKEIYELHIKVAVISALENTTIIPNFIYDGDDDDLCIWMRKRGVNVIHARVPFASEIIAARETGYLSDVALGAFLRTEIPNIDQSDDVVLYTDCDVMFLSDPIYRGEPIRYFAAAPESDMHDYSVHGINTGCMFINLKNMRRCYFPFINFVKSQLTSFAAFDQGAFRIFFNGLWERMDPIHNWKPYWGYNSRASIIHFHGPKYHDLRKIQEGQDVWWRVLAMYHGNIEAYRVYRAAFEKFLLKI